MWNLLEQFHSKTCDRNMIAHHLIVNCLRQIIGYRLNWFVRKLMHLGMCHFSSWRGIQNWYPANPKLQSVFLSLSFVTFSSICLYAVNHEQLLIIHSATWYLNMWVIAWTLKTSSGRNPYRVLGPRLREHSVPNLEGRSWYWVTTELERLMARPSLLTGSVMDKGVLRSGCRNGGSCQLLWRWSLPAPATPQSLNSSATSLLCVYVCIYSYALDQPQRWQSPWIKNYHNQW